MTDEKPNGQRPRWGVVPRGNDNSLAYLKQALPEGFDPYVEERGDDLILWAALQDAQPQEIFERVDQFLVSVHGALAINGFCQGAFYTNELLNIGDNSVEKRRGRITVESGDYRLQGNPIKISMRNAFCDLIPPAPTPQTDVQ